MSTKSPLDKLEKYVGAQLELDRKTLATPAAHAAECQCTAEQHAPSGRHVKEVAHRCNARPFRETPPHISRIIVAVDHDRHAAFEYALMLAYTHKAQVAAIHVLEPINAMAAENEFVFATATCERTAAAENLVASVRRQLPAEIESFASLREGDAATELLAAAAEWNADLIVMGTHRRGPVARIFLGSTSQAVLRRATCPVLLISDEPAA